jgi:predicted O-methyltransferase YrrM
MHQYEFTQEWALNNVQSWTKLLQRFVGAPVRFLEVGSFEGRSTTWFLDNVLTHPDAHIHCIDTFGGSVEHAKLDLSELEQRFDHNTAPHAAKVTKSKGPSQVLLRELPPGSFDFAYVDGSHEAPDVLMDAVLVWDLVKPGGLIIFDDYGGGAPGVRIAVDAFMSCMEGRFDLAHKGYQVAITRTE